MGFKEAYCNNCVDFHRNRGSSSWGSLDKAIRGCPRCQDRYKVLEMQNETYRHNLFLANLSLEKQKTEFETALSKLTLEHTLELKRLTENFNIVVNKVTFLKVSRDSLDDVVLEVQGLKIFASKTILADKSHVFRKMFGSGMLETQTGKIQMEGASFAVMDAVVKFCYTGEISFSETVPPDEVLKVADMYDILYLKDSCESELCETISIDNLPSLLKLSRAFKARKLQEKTGKFFKDHFDELKDRVYESFEAPTTESQLESRPVESSVTVSGLLELEETEPTTPAL